jgi:hypothetical protein
MRKNVWLWLPVSLSLFWLARTDSSRAQRAAEPAPSASSFKITFGERQESERDYTGTLTLSEGRVTSLAPWRFLEGDAVQGTSGWKLTLKRMSFENQPDQGRPLNATGQIENIVPAGVVAGVDAPPAAQARVKTAAGEFSFRLSELQNGRLLLYADGDITVQRVPSAARVSDADAAEQDYPSLAMARDGAVWVAWQSYREQAEQVLVRHSVSGGWSPVETLTSAPGDIFRTAIAEDGAGRMWVVWSQREGAAWRLMARSFAAGRWSAPAVLTPATAPNIFHRLVRAPDGALHLVWIGHREGQSRVYWRALRDGRWSEAVEVGGPAAWMPDAAADSKGNLYVAWDSYAAGNYDIYLRRIAAGGAPGPVMQVTSSPRFEAHASVAVDGRDRVWVAWDESGVNWGKDWARDDTWRGTVLYANRRPRVAVLDGATWKQPVGDPMSAVPRRYNRFAQTPRLACDVSGRMWMALAVRVSVSVNRVDYFAGNGRWEWFLSSFDGDRWTPAAPIPMSGTRPDGILQLQPGRQGVWAAFMNDNRPFGRGAAGGPNRSLEIAAASFAEATAARDARLEEFDGSSGQAAPVHLNESADVARMRAFRLSHEGRDLRILRGDFHRHTEISGDGAGDGSLEDNYRYAIDGARMDTGIVADHNAGGTEYSWWRTEKANDLFRVEGGYTPLFGYERSVPYPNGHRNLVFAQRGVKVLPIAREEAKGALNTGPILYPYLKQNRGICMLHSLATGQGSDYRDNDPSVEPIVEIYQGYHANYEYAGAPRSEAAGYAVSAHGPVQPLGFYWNALAKGYKLGVQSSSDHISTHTSYTMIFAPSTARADIVEAMRQRHTYGATDNIVLDFRATAGGRAWMMGDAFDAAAPPRFTIKAQGTSEIDTVEIVKDGKFVYTSRPSSAAAEFTWTDNAPGAGESWYYVRVIQKDRQMAWASPIWVRYK